MISLRRMGTNMNKNASITTDVPNFLKLRRKVCKCPINNLKPFDKTSRKR